MGAVLGHLGALNATARTALADALHPVILSRAGNPVGAIRVVEGGLGIPRGA
jgi:hypothetical protein